MTKSHLLHDSCHKEWMIDSVVVPMASVYGLAKEYKYLKPSIREFLTGLFSFCKFLGCHAISVEFDVHKIVE